MPKPKYKISEYLLSSLKFKLEEKLTFQIFTKLECRKVSELIKQEKDLSISESTIYRLFLWKGHDNLPYLHTLDIISQYIGFNDWFSLEKYFNELIEFQHLYGVFPDQQQYKSLLSINIHSGSLKPLYLFLVQFSSDLPFDKKVILGEDIHRSLIINPNSNLEFYKQFHNLTIVREGFFEILADPDFTIPDYEIGLGYYLNNIKPQESIKALQDYIFANSLLLRYYFQKGKKELVLKIGSLLYLDLNLSTKDLKEVYIFPKMRYFCYRLFYDECFTGLNKNYLEWLIDFTHSELRRDNSIESRVLLHTLLDTLEIYPKIQNETFNLFFINYPEIFSNLPNHILKLTMKQRLRFLDPNGTQYLNIRKS
jgi:hypothetical protein